MKRFGSVLLLLAGLTITAGDTLLAQRPTGDAASFAAYSGYRAVPNITYTTASGVELKLDFYGPARPSGPVPTAIFMHGGGYRVGSRKEASVLSLLPYVQMGWNAVNVEYRASGIAQAPAAVEDARCALRWAIHNAKEYNVDPSRIYLMGNSSGGSAVWTYATRYPERWTAIAPSAAPLEDDAFPYEKLKTVPVLVIHGDMDTTMVFSASETMVQHAKAKGVSATWLPVPGGAHTDAWAQPAIITQIFDFFDAHKTKMK